MEVICIYCEKTRNANDCWCCIDKGSRHYECKFDAECEKIKEKIKIRRSVKIQIPNVKPPLPVKTEKLPPTLPPIPKKLPQVVVKPPGASVDLRDIDVKISDQPLQKMEIEDWAEKSKPEGIFSSFLSLFSISSYKKIKNE